MKRPATNHVRFTFALLLLMTFLAASADAKHVFNGKIAFTSDRNGDQEIFLMNADGTNQARLTTNSASDLYPVWSPDGTKIAFYSNRDGNDEIYVMNADGSGQTRLTNNALADHQPAFSPDGTKILFQSNRDGNSPQIYIMNANGSSQTRLTNNASTDSEPVFSPDGDKILFNRSGNSSYDIASMNADGSGVVLLTSNTASDTSAAGQPIHHAETIGVFRPATAQFLLRNSNTAGGANSTIPFGQSTDLPIVGDWGGDGVTDVGVFRNGQFLLRQPITINIFGHPVTTIINTITVNFGQAGDLPVVGDWNGDGIDTPGVFRPSSGQWLLTNSPNINNSTPVATIFFNFGQAGDTPLAGDWNSDGIDTVGLYRGSISSFILSNTFNGTIDIPTFLFGSLGSVGFTGDWNADGFDTAGVFNKNIGVMGLNNTNTSGNGVGDITFSFGQNGDVPLVGDWDGQP